MQNKKIKDIVDIHVTSQKTMVDAFSQYPLLDGTRKYTVELTEFVCPLNISALPDMEFFEDDAGNTNNYFFEIRRKRQTAHVIAMNTIGDSMATLLDAPAGNPLFPDDAYYRFRKAPHRRMETVSEMLYHMQRFFDDFIDRYRTTALNATIDGGTHGGVGEIIGVNHNFVNVSAEPSGLLRLTFHNTFTDNFYLEATDWGTKMLGFTTSVIAFREAGGIIHKGLDAMLGIPNGLTIIEGGTVQSIEMPCNYSLYRYFEHRVRIEIETQIGIPYTSVWSTSNSQQIAHVLATFPIVSTHQGKVDCNEAGVTLEQVSISDKILKGEIIWRSAEDKISERFLLNSSQFFHNIRLEVFIVRKKLAIVNGIQTNLFKRDKMTFEDGEYWTAKLRFRSIN
jgi:hypothetical protein